MRPFRRRVFDMNLFRNLFRMTDSTLQRGGIAPRVASVARGLGGRAAFARPTR
jgi:hypothetical protein